MRKYLASIVMLATATALAGDFATGFEPSDYNGSKDGVVITGQQGWTLPSGTDGKVFTYKDNALGFVDNPHPGGQHFLGTRPTDNLTFGRAEHAFDFSAGGEWVARYDFAAIKFGDTIGVQNLGSFSLQSSTTARSFIALNTWTDPNNPTSWQAGYNVYDSAGVALATQYPGSAWQNLALNHWYRQETRFNFADNRVTSVSITDLHTGTKTTFKPEGWYMLGGANPTQPLPVAVRFFGGGDQNQAMGWDNLFIPEPSAALLLVVGGMLGVRRWR